ncbi:MAG: hypothetical protein SPJ62_01075 [Inconstantimicrobium porci]|uniref:hypothetical protein n=1 Tax=Inconstantimicrobium porci TaxID=2652291 RepID=UPI002A91A1F2|nr:hypothetical protein [Inconstantimicrobium porci]MDY5910611.1 hypothetical protein [Inconstantimicrobium porci]
MENNSPLCNKKFTKDEEIVICNKAINSYGNASQKIKAIEEMGELIQAISKSLLDNKNNVEEEIADVEIMLTQLKIMYNLSDVENWRNYKLNRLKDRVW